MQSTLTLAKSTKENPINFFEVLFTTNFLDLLRKDFLKSKEVDWEKGEWFSVDAEKEIYIHYIDYCRFPDDIPGYIASEVDNQKWYSKTFSFTEYFHELLKKEHLNTISIIDGIIPSKTSENATHLVNVWVESLLFFRGKCNEQPYVNYIECARPLEAIIRYILERYPAFSPSIKRFPILKEIRNKIWGKKDAENIQLSGESKKLKDTIFDALAEFIFDGEPLFEYQVYVNIEEKKNISNVLKRIARGNPVKNTYIKFNCAAMVAHYVLGELSRYFPEMNLKELERTKAVKIKGYNGDTYKAENSYSYALRFKQNPNKHVDLKKKIDELFLSHEM